MFNEVDTVRVQSSQQRGIVPLVDGGRKTAKWAGSGSGRRQDRSWSRGTRGRRENGVGIAWHGRTFYRSK